MARKSPAPHATWKKLRDFALALPEANEEFPWGDRVAKVRKKIFIFLGEGTGDDPRVSLKLAGDAHQHALSLPGVKPTAYNLGKAGWVTIPLAGSGAPPGLLVEWTETSYCLVAPKKLRP
jgi:predicted DNA-binding protein (MmcQ/YjbR family)